MFASDPQQTIVAMLQVEYQVNFYKGRYHFPKYTLGSSSSRYRARRVADAKRIIGVAIDCVPVSERELAGLPVKLEGVAAARKGLAELGDHEQWWVRVYVARMMNRVPALGVKNVLKSLRQDENRFVKAAALGS